jgi:hypothetical protein
VSAREADRLVSRLERSALRFCLAAAAVALGVRRGCADVALGILGGGALIGVSYWAIKRGVDGVLALFPAAGAALAGGAGGAPARRPGPAAWAPILVRFAGRYALLAVIAYVMIARFRLHPVGLVIGVSSVLVAASIEAVRSLSPPAGAGRGSPNPPR